jgi:hypothetical protein
LEVVVVVVVVLAVAEAVFGSSSEMITVVVGVCGN